MDLSKRWKILIGLLTAWVSLYPLLIFLFMFFPIIGVIISENTNSQPPPYMFVGMLAIFPIIFISIFLQFSMWIFYTSHTITNNEGEDFIRIFLSCVNYIFPYVGMPVYYFTYIFPDSPPNWAIKEEYRNTEVLISQTAEEPL